MEKILIYDNITYNNFSIDEYGNIKNNKTSHIYKASIGAGGYLIVTLPMGKRGKVKSIRVHKAVAETFIPNPNNYPIVLHKDDNKLNPHISNLEWGTHKQNTQQHLKKLSKDTEYYNNRKLTKQDIEFIKRNKDIMTRAQLANRFNVSKTTITNIITGKYYN